MYVGTSPASTTFAESACGHPDSLSSPGGMLKSPPSTKGPPYARKTWATMFMMPMLSPVKPMPSWR